MVWANALRALAHTIPQSRREPQERAGDGAGNQTLSQDDYARERLPDDFLKLHNTLASSQLERQPPYDSSHYRQRQRPGADYATSTRSPHRRGDRPDYRHPASFRAPRPRHTRDADEPA